MRVERDRQVLSALAGAGLWLCLCGPAGAQESEKRREPMTTPEERVEDEGLFRLREDYFARRRQKPGDPSFDAAKARLDAVRAIESQVPEQSLMNGSVSPVAWSNIGPAPINLGQTPTSNRIPSDVSGRVTGIAIDPVDNSVYIAGAQGGVWKSTDNGATWTPLTDFLTTLAIGSIAIDPAAHAAGSATIYVGTGEGNSSCDSYGGVGVYKSVNSGATWTGPTGTAQFQNRGITSIAVDRTNSSHVLLTSGSGAFSPACTSGPVLPSRGIYESNDGGGTWTQRTSNNNRASVVLQDPVTATTWWGALWFTGNLGHDGGLVKSTNNGLSWNQIGGTGGLPAVNSTWGRAYISATVDNPVTPTNSVLYLGTSASSGSLFKSVDSGINWTAVPAANGYCDGQCFYDMPVYVEPGDPNRVYLGGAGQSTTLPVLFMRSDNGGTSFADKVRSPSTSTALHADMHFITSWPGQPNRIWVANDGGVWRSDDRGDTWVNVNAGLAITQFSGCDLHPTDPNSAYAGSQDNGTEGWQGLNNWKHLDFGDGGFALVDQGNPSNLVHTYFNQTSNLIGVGFTTGGFATTMGFYNVSFAGPPPNGNNNGIAFTDRVEFYAPIHLDRGVSNTLYFGTNRLWRANNFFVTGGTGGEFSAVNAAQDLAPGGGALSAIETFANPTPATNADLIYTGSDNGHVFRTTNGTAGTPTWTEVDIGGSALWVSDILVDPSNSNVVYQARAGYAAAAGLNVRKSVNGGANWAPSATGIPNIPVNALALDPVTPNRIWAGTDVGIYVSSDAGANWAPYANRLPPVAVFDLKANATTKQLLACTHGRSAYMLSLDDDLIFRDGVESHGFSNWSSVQNDGDLTVTPAAAMGGSTVGLQAVVNGTNALFVQDDLPNNEPRYRTRLYINPNTFDPGEAQSHFRVRVMIGFNGAGERLVTLVLKRQGGQYSIEGRVRRNDGTRADTGFINITNAAHFIEFDWVKAATGLANGTFTFFIDGVPQPTLTGIDNDASGIESARMGVLSIKTGAAGTLFLDQFVSRRVNYNGPES